MHDQNREARIKRRAANLGYRIVKSNWRRDTIDNHGDYMIVENDRNICVDGQRYDLSIEYVESWLDDMGRAAA
ncbi:hypothetical protein ASD99_14880 [Mesorhizobium sp. Root695]|uniref:hypothetical protein n=1 Tax=Mesorhizobium sp. Root695 TaxID=1736589 RepID=UPI00070AAE93|nr:hypothetical protein [Mesorhizobium sp. Root695]KRB13952.1 hypothetical protein ASD99_14880 [Mesorhizobium sp. Root695]